MSSPHPDRIHAAEDDGRAAVAAGSSRSTRVVDGTRSVEEVARILRGTGRGDAVNDALLPATGGLHEDVPYPPYA